MRPLLILAAAVAAATAPMLACAAEAPLIIHFNDRPPLHYLTPQGKLAGFVAAPALAALNAAAIPYTLRQTPAKYQLTQLQANQEPACMMSWTDAPGRDRLGKFTETVYRDGRPLALTWAGNKAMDNEEPLRQTLSNPTLRLLVKEGASYGPAIDRALIRYKTASTATTGDTRQMLDLLRQHRIDYFFITEQEADDALKASGHPAADFKRIYFSDLTRGEDRRLWCSRITPDEVIGRLNAALLKQRH